MRSLNWTSTVLVACLMACGSEKATGGGQSATPGSAGAQSVASGGTAASGGSATEVAGSGGGGALAGGNAGNSAGSQTAGAAGADLAGAAGAAGSEGDAPLTGDGCAGGTCLNPTCQALGTPIAPGALPQLAFEGDGAKPSYIPNDVVIPTLDDVPDGVNAEPDPAYGLGGHTATILDYLDQNKLHFDLFINTNNWCGDVTMDPACEATLVRILKTQNAGSHSVHHLHMGLDLPPVDGVQQSCDGATSGGSCVPELEGVESVVAQLSRGGRAHLTRFRPPFGEPYFEGEGNGQAQKDVAKLAVAVGWHMDAHDADYEGVSCAETPCPTGEQIAKNVLDQLGTGPGNKQWGILLMHGVFPWSVEALRILFGEHGNDGEIAKRGFRIGTVEDAVCWRFGKHSWQLVSEANPGTERGPN